MGRPLLIVVLVGLLIATGVAGAAPAHETRIPIGPSAPIEPVSLDQVVVARGDHLWKISERHIDATSPGLGVAPYWLEVIDLNRPGLRSGDPDLIYPGEVIVLPEVSGPP
jgi:nucleoid-associated protein YgaU